MSLRTAAARVVLCLLLVLFAAPARARHFVDADGRRVPLPEEVGRVMAANPAGAVIVFVLNPSKLIGWPQPLTRRQRAYLPTRYARLPVVGPLAGPGGMPDAAALAAVATAQRPDLIVEMSLPSPGRAAIADRVEQQTGIPYIVLDADVEDASEMLRKLGTILGVDRRGRDLRNYVEHALSALRGKLLIRPADNRPRVYYGRGRDGLETGLASSLPMEDIAQAGAINVAAHLGPPGGLVRITPAELLDWDPAVIIAEDRSFYDALHRYRRWRSLSAVRNKRVYLAPADPFGWIDDPPGVNRVIGLYWLASIFYPDAVEQDLRSLVSDFYDKFYSVKLSGKQLEALVGRAEANPGETKRPVNVPLLGAEPTPIPGSPLNLPPGALPMHPPGRGGLPPLPPLPGGATRP
jgi:iron complex transport system substrate-binding protein